MLYLFARCWYKVINASICDLYTVEWTLFVTIEFMCVWVCVWGCVCVCVCVCVFKLINVRAIWEHLLLLYFDLCLVHLSASDFLYLWPLCVVTLFVTFTFVTCWFWPEHSSMPHYNINCTDASRCDGVTVTPPPKQC